MALTSEQKRTLNAFWLAAGVRSATHRKALVRKAEVNGLFRDPERLVERMIEIEDLMWRAVGIPEIDIGVMMGRYPNMLYFEPEFQVERLRLFRSLLPNVNLRRVLERNPQVLGMDMTCTLPAKMRELSVLLPHTDIIHLIERHPKILSSNVGNAVSRNLSDLKALMSEVGVVEHGVELMIAHSPRLLTSNIRGTIRQRLEHVEAMSPGTFRKYADKPASISRMLCASEKALDRIEFLKKMHPDVSRSEIATVNMPVAKFVERYPDFDEWQRKFSQKRIMAAAEQKTPRRPKKIKKNKMTTTTTAAKAATASRAATRATAGQTPGAAEAVTEK